MVYFWVPFKISKIQNIPFTGNLLLYSHMSFYNNDVIIMTSLVLKAQLPYEIFSCPDATLGILGPGVTSKNEQVKTNTSKFLPV